MTTADVASDENFVKIKFPFHLHGRTYILLY